MGDLDSISMGNGEGAGTSLHLKTLKIIRLSVLDGWFLNKISLFF
jgi:hypothetical protein